MSSTDIKGWRSVRKGSGEFNKSGLLSSRQNSVSEEKITVNSFLNVSDEKSLSKSCSLRVTDTNKQEKPLLKKSTSSDLIEKSREEDKKKRHKRTKSTATKDKKTKHVKKAKRKESSNLRNSNSEHKKSPRLKDSKSSSNSKKSPKNTPKNTTPKISTKNHSSEKQKSVKINNTPSPKTKKRDLTPNNQANRKYRPSSQNLGRSRLLRCVKASSPFNGVSEGELTNVKVGDDIALRGIPSAGWCEGECNGITGWFPIEISNELLKELGLSEKDTNPQSYGIDNQSLIANKVAIRNNVEKKLRKRPNKKELLDRNIINSTDSDSLRSTQLLKSMEQQKTAALISNTLSGRSSVKGMDPITVNDLREFNDETSYTCASEGSEEDTLEDEAIKLFATKPTKAINMMIENDLLEDTPSAIADFLYCNPLLAGKMVGDYLGENEEKNLRVLEAFLDKLNLKDTEFDQAMRKFLFVFYLPGEAQKIDRIMCAFAKKYYNQNKTSTSPHGSIFPNEDSVYLLAFATIMLNTDLHSMNVKTKMTQDEFVKRTNDGSFPDVFLRDLYQRILEEEIRTKDEKFTRASKRGYLFLEKRVGIRNKKKHIQYWCVLDPESGFLYVFKEKDEAKQITSYELNSLQICDKQIPTPDKRGLYPLKFQYSKRKPPDMIILVRSQRLWVDWLTIFTEVLESK